jgi:2-keto-3-deoxy-L-rhamnonate aldolase RhmA
MTANPVRQKLRAGGTSFGTMAFEFFTPGLARILVSAGAEYVILDQEHSGVGIDTIKAQVGFARGAGLVPIVRVPNCTKELICPVLDAGALGIMVPMVESAEEAQALVQWCRYRPLGRRGLGLGLGNDDYKLMPPRAAMDAANESILTIAMIETTAGLRNARAILGTPGIDLGWIGHFDLSDSMGIAGDFTNPRFTTAEADIIAAGREVGTPLGWLANNGAQARDGIARGFRALCLSTDVALLRSALATEIAAART